VWLAGIAGGLLVGRAVHVALNWAYFELERGEIWQLNAGGQDWRGAFLGALLGMWLMARLRDVPFDALLDGLAPVLPMIALAGWWGCGAAHCAYGKEVENLSFYPAWQVWEEADIYNLIAPRYATQRLGMILAWAALVIVLAVMWRGWLKWRRLWLALVLIAAGMFALGFLRGDYAVLLGGLRLGQWLDLALALLSIIGLLKGIKTGHDVSRTPD
jgi:prolipoprotein diacylglyceryltransferase